MGFPNMDASQIRPKKASRILELSDGRDDDHKPIDVDVDSSDENKATEIDDSGDDAPTETAEAELGRCPILLKLKLTLILERLSNDWTSPIYAFFKPTPSIEYINDRHVHIFECSAKSCRGKENGRLVLCYLDTSDCKSTGKLHKHAPTSWGVETVAAADETRSLGAAFEALKKCKDGQ